MHSESGDDDDDDKLVRKIWEDSDRDSSIIGVARILYGGAFSFAKKVDDLFLVVALTDRLNIPSNL